jgi:uncharacterized membrane protein
MKFLKDKIFQVIFIVFWLCAPVFADSWTERPDASFHAHPLIEIVKSSRTFARGEIVKVLKPSSGGRSGLIKVMVASGENRGKTVYAKIFSSSHAAVQEKEGVNVIISYFNHHEEPQDIMIDGYDRTGMLVVLAAVFIGMVVLVGGRKSLYSLLALSGVFLLIKFVYIPAILSGHQPIPYTLVTVTAIVVMTLISIGGFGGKAAAAIAGSLAGLATSLAFGYVFYKAARISGFFMEEIQLLNYYSPVLGDKPVGFFRNFLLSVLVLGASGVVMGVGISVASAMNEIKAHHPGITTGSLFQRGMGVGKDVVTVMANTLVVAYLGAHLGAILVKSLHVDSFFQLANMEFFHVGYCQAVLGSAGFLVCAFITAWAGSLIIKDKT